MDFNAAESQFRSINLKYQRGQLSDHDYQAAVGQISVQDHVGRRWKIQPYSGQWYVHDRGQWQPATPDKAQFDQVIATGAQNVQPHKKKKTWLYLGGCVLGLTVVVCFVVSLSMFGIIGLGFIGGMPPEGRVIQTQEAMLNNHGGTYEIGGLTVTIGPNNLDTQVPLVLTEFDIPMDAGVENQTSLFLVEGIPHAFNGELQIQIDLTQSMLDALDWGKEDPAEQLSFYIGSYYYSPSFGGMKPHMLPVEAVINLEEGSAAFQLKLHEGLGQASEKVMASIMPAQAQNTTQAGFSENAVFFMVKNDGGQERIVSEHFAVYYPNSMGHEQILPVVEQLEWVYQDLMAKGWEWPNDALPYGGKTIGEFKVYIQDCDSKAYVFWGKTTDECQGQFKVNILTGGVSLLIHPRTVKGDSPIMKATVGHELMHAAQYGFHMNRDGYTFRSWFRLGGGADSWMMLDEAVATWYEQHATGDHNWIPDQAVLHAEFYRHPWFYERKREAAEHAGYGASWFIQYLVREYGTEFILEAYKAQHIIGGSDALLHGLQVSGIDKSLSGTLFPGFLDQYFLETEPFADGLRSQPDFRNIINTVLHMEVNRQALEFNTKLIDRGTRDSIRASANPGTIVSLENGQQALETPALVTITAPLPASMTAYYFYYQIPGDGASWQQDQVITIETSGGGVMVYGHDKDNWIVEYAAVNNPLSESGRRELTVDASKYQGLEFILFNDSSLSNSASQLVSVKITYGQAGVEASEQTPLTDIPIIDFNARALLIGVFNRLGFRPERDFSYIDCNAEECIERAIIDTPGCFKEVLGFKLFAGEAFTDINNISFIPANSMNDLFFIELPEVSTYRGLTTSYAVIGLNYEPTDYRNRLFEMYLMGYDFSLVISSSLTTYDVGCDLGVRGQRDLFNLVDAILEVGVQQGMFAQPE